MRGAHNASDNPTTGISVGGSDAPNTLLMFSPTARARVNWPNPGAPNQPHSRFAQQVYMTGYKERVSLQASAPFLWRRIVFWSSHRIPNAIGPKKGGGDASTFAYYTRQMTPIQNTVELRDLVFQGQDGIDYDARTLLIAPLNHHAIDVQMDKTYNLNAVGGSMPRIQNRKHFYRGGKLIYADTETGNVNASSPWSTHSRKSRGNMYILDVFGDNGFSDSKTQVGKFQTEGRLYWSE